MSKENIATKIERWFQRARAANKFRDFHLVVNPEIAEVMLHGNGSSRLKRIMKAGRCKVNLIRETTMNQTDYRIYNAADNSDITDRYDVTRPDAADA